ncbi:FAD-dependent oxidoreductase [Pseudonocardia spinosispora]|uniref:FAD-dependent oxidoreductase n=1 Tax=Pseudonocardia spinosispora TaxID=103441 RepID=UPI000402D26F|nr:FAD-dependent oxidoreductase [Pseudonocardia spinosispora]
MDTVRAELLVIGFGKGGKTLAAAMGRAGKRVVLVEQSDQMYGGTCINIGCVPTKALVHQADERRDEDEPGSWYRQAIGSVQSLTTLLRGNNFRMLDTIDAVTVVTGQATFVDPHTVEVRAGDDRLTITADTIAINTGSLPVVPDIPGLAAGAHTVTSTDLLSTEDLPKHLAILGGGYLGVEFAAMYRRFGAEVTVFEAAERMLGREDDDVAEAAVEILAGDGITLLTGSAVTALEDTGECVTISYERGGEQRSLTADKVLVAAGRAPATDGLNLEAAGVDTGPRGSVVVDEYLRTSQPHIFALGDVNGGPQFTYISLDDSRVVLDQLAGAGKRSTADRVAVPTTVFMTPPLATVGLTEKAARAAGHPVRVARKAIGQIAAMPRSRIMGDTRGLMKFVIDSDTDRILGAALLSIDAQELVNTVALAMRHGVTATELRDSIYTHPSSTEAFNEVLATIVSN